MDKKSRQTSDPPKQKEWPLPLKAERIRSLLDGRMSQIRLIIKPRPISRNGSIHDNDLLELLKRCPYGQPGDRLWVRETHYRWGKWFRGKWRFRDDAIGFERDGFLIPADDRRCEGWHKRPAIFLPRKLARIKLEITKIRVEWLQEITDSDAKAEGVNAITVAEIHRQATWNDRQDFAQVWNHINGVGAWERNDRVWVLEFGVIR